MSEKKKSLLFGGGQIWGDVQFSSAQFSLSVMSNSLWPHELQHHQLPESTQTRVHRVSDAIQPSHPLSSPSPPALNLSQHQGLFKWVSSSHQVAISIGVSASTSVLPMNTQDWSPLGWIGWISLQSNGETIAYPIYLCCVLCLVSHVWLFVTPWTIAHQAPLSMGFSSKNPGVHNHFLLQGIFPTQGLNLHLPCLLHCRGFFTSEPLGKPILIYVVERMLSHHNTFSTSLPLPTSHVSKKRVLCFLGWAPLSVLNSVRQFLCPSVAKSSATIAQWMITKKNWKNSHYSIKEMCSCVFQNCIIYNKKIN